MDTCFEWALLLKGSMYVCIYSTYIYLQCVCLQYSKCLFILKIDKSTDPADDHCSVMVTTAANTALGC